jgi:hypothetical protein
MSQEFIASNGESDVWFDRDKRGSESGRYSADQDKTSRITCSAVIEALRVEGERIPSVQVIYLRPDGLEFVMTGTDLTPDLYETCAEVACRVQQAVDKSGAIYVEGGWRRGQQPIEGWLVAYSRER